MSASVDFGKLLLRLSIGGMMLLHGIAKFGTDLAFIKAKLLENGLPEIISYGVYIGEIAAPLLMIIGLKTKMASWLRIFTMLFAIYLGNPSGIFALNEFGGWAVELKMLYVFGSLAIVFLGAGRYAFDKH